MTQTPAAVPVTAKSFDALVKKEGVVFLDWWASWCGPCRAFAPIYEQAAQRHKDIVWGKVDTDAEQELAAAFEIRSIPTLMIFRDGILLFEQPGMVPGKALDELAEKVRALDMADVRRKIAAAEAAERQAKAG